MRRRARAGSSAGGGGGDPAAAPPIVERGWRVRRHPPERSPKIVPRSPPCSSTPRSPPRTPTRRFDTSRSPPPTSSAPASHRTDRETARGVAASLDDDDAGETRAATIEVLRRAGIAPDAWVVCELSDRCRTGVGHAYVGTPVRATALVEGALDLNSASPRRYFFETAAVFATHPREAERLRRFASKDGATSCGTTTSASVGACASFSTIFHPWRCRSVGC